MTDVLLIAFGVLGWIAAFIGWRELYKWAKQCQNARIAIAHKRRVQYNEPLTAWLGWANALGRDESVRGRIVYRNGHVTVAVLRPKSTSKFRTAVTNARASRRQRRVPVADPAPVQATPRRR